MYYKYLYRFILCLLTLALFACRPEEPKTDNTDKTETPEDPEEKPETPEDPLDPSTKRDYDFLFELNTMPKIEIKLSKTK